MNPRASNGHGVARAAAGSLVVAASLCLTVCLFAPASVFFANILDFFRTFADLWPSLAAAALVGSLVLAALLIALPLGRPRDIGVAAIFALAVLTWIQSNFLLWDYGVLAGQPIDWMSHWRAAVVDAAVWAVTLAAFMRAFRTMARVAPAASAALILLQGVGLAIQVERSPDLWYDHIAFDDSARFSFSRGTNVVIILLDTFQSDLFQELLDEDSGLQQRLQGFTYFRNATAGFPSTAPSIAFILTGRQFDNSTPFLPFVRTAFKTSSLPQALKTAGFDVYYNNPYYWVTVYADDAISSHVVPRPSMALDADTIALAKALLRLGAFRSLPQIGKQLLAGEAGTLPPLPAAAVRTADTDSSASAAMAFFTAFDRQASATTTAPVFRYYHLWGIHPPLAYDEQLRPLSAKYTRANAKRQAKGLMTRLESLCRTLADRGVYDRTVLLFLGDHGTSFVPRLVNGGSNSTGAVETRVPTRQSYGLPLVLVKPVGATGPLQISDAPVSLGDVPRTVMDAVGLPNTFPGMSMLGPAPPPDRGRTVFYYDPGALRLTNAFFPNLTEFTVSGFSWLDRSWRKTGRVFTPDGARTLIVGGSYPWGTRVLFKAGGNSELYQTSGWSVPEAALTWTTGHTASLLFRVSQPAADLRLHADVQPYLPATATRQRVEVYAHDQKVADWSVTARGVYEATVPKSLAADGSLDLRFDMPDAESPRSPTGQVLDQRELAIAVISLEIEEMRPAAGAGGH